MLLSIFSQTLPLSLLLIQHTVSAPVSTNTTTELTIPETPGFSLAAKIPFTTPSDFILLDMLYLTCESLYNFAAYSFSSPAGGASKTRGNLRIRVARNAESPSTVFQVKHAVWGLWKAAVQQLQDKDYRAGLFVLDAAPSTRGRARNVGNVQYITTSAPAEGSGSASGNRTLEPVVAPPNDVTSRRRRDLIIPAATTDATTTGVSFPGFGNTNATTGAATPANRFWLIQLTEFSTFKLTLTNLFITVFEAIAEYASLPQREILTGEWTYESETTGYMLGLRHAPGFRGLPPLDAIMGSMAHLPEAMSKLKRFVECWFDVVDSDTKERVLQGFLAKAGAEGKNFSAFFRD